MIRSATTIDWPYKFQPTISKKPTLIGKHLINIAAHKNEEHKEVYFCRHCNQQFLDKKGLADHKRTIHTDPVRPEDMVRTVVRTSSDLKKWSDLEIDVIKKCQ